MEKLSFIETPCAYNADRKARFHAQSKARLKLLALELALPADSYDIRSNKGGIAVSGEVTLHGESIYVQISQSCLGGGMGVLVRTCKGRKDYSGGKNHWLPLSTLRDIRILAHYVRRVVAESVWNETPAEYRSTIGNARYVLEMDATTGATCLVPLETSRKVLGR